MGIRDTGLFICHMGMGLSLNYRLRDGEPVPFVREKPSEREFLVGELPSGDAERCLTAAEEYIAGHESAEKKPKGAPADWAPDPFQVVRPLVAARRAVEILRGKLPTSRRSA